MIKLKKITATFLVVKKITADFIGEKVGLICRFVSNFNGTDSYAEFDNDIALTSDFEIKGCFKIASQVTSNQAVFGDDNTTLTLFLAAGTDNLSLQIPRDVGGSDYITVNGAVLYNEINHYSVARIGNVYTVIINETSDSDSVTDYTQNVNVSTLGRWNGILYFGEGVLLDFMVYSGGDSSTGTLITDLPMDESINGQTGNVDYINRTGNADYNATGYNITVTEECSEIPPPESNNLTYNNGADNVTYDNGNDNVVY